MQPRARAYTEQTLVPPEPIEKVQPLSSHNGFLVQLRVTGHVCAAGCHYLGVQCSLLPFAFHSVRAPLLSPPVLTSAAVACKNAFASNVCTGLSQSCRMACFLMSAESRTLSKPQGLGVQNPAVPSHCDPGKVQPQTLKSKIDTVQQPKSWAYETWVWRRHGCGRHRLVATMLPL